jgi:hypothetical protein
MSKPNFNGPWMDPPEPDPDEVRIRELNHIADGHEITIGETLAGYVTLGPTSVVIESADPTNEWEMTVTHKDLGERLVNPTKEDVLEAVKAWVYDHIDDFEGVEE